MISRRRALTTAGATIAAASLPGFADTPQMLTRKIPSTGEPLGVIGLGNSQAFKSSDMDTTQQLLSLLAERGGSFVDARGISRFNVLKAAPPGVSVFLAGYVDGLQIEQDQADTSALRQLRAGQPVDVFTLSNLEEMDKRWNQLRQWKQQGLCRYIGVGKARSTFYPAMMKLMATGTVDFVQINYSMLEREAEDRLLPLAVDKGVAVVTSRPFVNGDYFRLVSDHSLPDWASDFDCHSWAQFSLKFILGNPAVNCVLTETANPGHAMDNLDGGIGRLPDSKTREKMSALLRSF
jgi:diketogulonate reductase-like aldo/keto reductase